MSERQATKESVAELLIKKEGYEPYKRTVKTNHVRALVNPGSHFVFDAALSVGEDGEQIAEQGQKLDWFGYIQASEKSCDLHNIVARYLQGDVSVVNVGSPIYGDVAAMPTNVNELQDLAKRAKQGYENLSDEIKGIFNNNFEDFYNAVLNNTVDTKIHAYADAKIEAAKKAAQEAQAEEGKE